MIREALKKTHSISLFDERTQNGFPDAYYREGNDVILFEIKDALFPSRAIDIITYTEVKDVVDEKYRTIREQVSQLLKMSVSSFEFKQGYTVCEKLNSLSSNGVYGLFLQYARDQHLPATGI